MPLCATSPVGAQKPWISVHSWAMCLLQFSCLKRDRPLGGGEGEGLRRARPPSLRQLCGTPSSLLFAACHGDRDQPRPGVSGDCLPPPCPEGPRAALQRQRQRSQAASDLAATDGAAKGNNNRLYCLRHCETRLFTNSTCLILT